MRLQLDMRFFWTALSGLFQARWIAACQRIPPNGWLVGSEVYESWGISLHKASSSSSSFHPTLPPKKNNPKQAKTPSNRCHPPENHIKNSPNSFIPSYTLRFPPFPSLQQLQALDPLALSPQPRDLHRGLDELRRQPGASGRRRLPSRTPTGRKKSNDLANQPSANSEVQLYDKHQYRFYRSIS